MISERITRSYQVFCDQCGEAAPRGLSEAEAIILAEEQGFERCEWHNGLDLVKRDLCQDCCTEQAF
jgi:hypothetical protein